MTPMPGRLEDIDLSRRNRLVVYYVLAIVGVVLLYTLLYNAGMRVFEGRPQSVFRSFQTVTETMTTTGYGADSPWATPVMNGFVVFMQLSGIAIGFFTLRLIIIPLFSEAEVNLDSRLTPKSDHVVICEYRRDSAVLLDELGELGVDYVLISSDKEEARSLSDAGYSVIHGSPQEAESFRRAGIDTARAVITDAGDANVNTILTVRSVRGDVEVVALTDDSDLEDVLLDAGADSVLSPRAVLGRRLAEKAVASFGGGLRDTIELGADIEVTEIPVHYDSQLVGTRVRDSGIRERTGANIIGAWVDGELQLPPDPDAVIRPNTVLLVSGGHSSLEELSEFTRPARSLRGHERVVVAGHGEVGRPALAVLEAAGIETVTIDTRDGEGVDVVGDARTKRTLREAGIEDAGAVIVGLPDDSAALLTTVTVRSLRSDIETLVRVSDTDATAKALSAGADYVLSVPQVSARMVAGELRGEDVLAPASQIRLIRVPATPFAGSTIASSGIYETTGCRVVAVDDGDSLSATVDPQRELTGDEQLVLVGTDEAVQQFEKRFEVSREESA
ncbi:potassium channel family protein [Salinirussus salinus]|uniref:potassium channel family protein n=1 Tax=Salinirussus salinus TaxID=1198300 RepID=UPI0013567DA9|nr:NAD-binding protein [Salinirussus salinus]